MHARLVDASPAVLGHVGAMPDLEAWRVFPQDVHAPREARRFVASALRRWERVELLDDAAVIVSELASNAVVHARSSLTVGVRCIGQRVVLTVHDTSAALPHVRLPDTESASGRGMQLVSGLSTRWGADAMHDGKTVWAELFS